MGRRSRRSAALQQRGVHPVQPSVQITSSRSLEDGVRRLLFGLSCIYPSACPTIKERYLLTGPLDHQPGLRRRRSRRRYVPSYNRNTAPLPGGDADESLRPQRNYDLEGATCCPRWSKDARSEGGRPRSRGDWGTGSPRREFLYSDDMADACVMMMNLPDEAFDQVCGPNDFRRQRRMRRGPEHRGSCPRSGGCRGFAARWNSTRASPTERRGTPRYRRLRSSDGRPGSI